MPLIPSEQELRDMVKEGKTLYQISRKFDMVIKEVFKLGRSYGISFDYYHNHIPKPTKQDLESMYHDEGMTQEQIAKEFDVTQQYVSNWLRYYNIPTRGIGTLAVTIPPKEVLQRHIEWREAVFDRDHRTCQMCGATNTLIHPHHIVPFADHPEVAYELENGITLCKECRKQIFGREYNYIEQFAAITQRPQSVECI